METPDAKTLDLSAVLSGQAYPKEKVRIYLNPAIAYEIGKVLARIDEANKAGESVEDLEAQLDDLEKKGQEHSMVVHVTSVPRETIQNVALSVIKDFPVEKDVFGREKPNAEAERAFHTRHWAARIEKIVHASGAELVKPSEEDIDLLRRQAPDAAITAIEKAIDALARSEQNGFEALVQRHDFLSQP